MALTAFELKMMKYLQENPEMLNKVQDPNAFVEAIAETRADRNHRFVLGAIDARERTNWTNDEREAQDSYIEEVCDVLDELAKLVSERFKVKSNEKGEAWHALSYLTEGGKTLSIKMDTSFGSAPNKVWSEPEKVAVPVAPKAPKK